MLRSEQLIVAIRTDASVQIGTGHVMRCLSLAARLRQEGAEVFFISRLLPGHLCNYIQAQDFPVKRLPAPRPGKRSSKDYRQWLGVSDRQDIMDACRALPRRRVDWLVVDHYALDIGWESKFRPHARNILVIDDLANRRHDCDLLLDQNRLQNVAARYEKLTPSNCRILLGPQYALLREEFQSAHQHPRTRNGSIRRAMVFFGGIDASNETAKAIRSIHALGNLDLEVDIIVGSSNPHRKTLGAWRSSRVKIYTQVNHMADLMQRADLAIGASGVTSWERCCVGLPSITVCMAENQKAIAEHLARAKAGIYLGLARNVTVAQISKAIKQLMIDHRLTRQLGRNAFRLVDGRGTERVLKHMKAIETQGDS